MFIDTHCHMTDEKLKNSNEILMKSKEMNVKQIITSGFDYYSSQQAVEFAQKYEYVFASVGVYPCEVDKVEDDYLEKLEMLAKNNKVVAIGEIGFELREGCPSFENQKKVFVQQLRLAYKLKKPVIIHCREAIGLMLETLKENKDLIVNGGTFHCFSESSEVAAEILKLGFHISVGGVSTFKNARKVKDAIATIPLDKIILETDSPYLAPEPFRGKINSPAFIPYIAENLAKLKNVSVQTVAKITSQNAQKLFKILGE